MRNLIVGFVLIGFIAACSVARAQDIRLLGVPAAIPAINALPLGDWIPPAEQPRATLEHIGARVKAPLVHVTAEELRALVVERYRTLRLLDAREQWTLAEAARHREALLPVDLDARAFARLVDRMVDAACDNPYVLAFITKASTRTFPQLEGKVAREGARLFPRVMAHAFVLDRLTNTMAVDWRVNVACRALWRRIQDTDPRFAENMHWFGRWKTHSVNLGIDEYNRSHLHDEAYPRTMGWILPYNILEAVSAESGLAMVGPSEARAGRLANARVGLTLVTHGAQGEGPSTFTLDRMLIALKHLSMKQWADLYATWNMSFVTNLGNWPFFMAKLLVPAVHENALEPSTYMHRRGIALQTHMYLNGLSRMDGTCFQVDWTDLEVTALWGLTNLESAADYALCADRAATRRSDR